MHLERSKNISISVDNNSSDIARFVDTEVDRLIQKRLLLDGNVSAKMKRKILETLTNGAQGMFRWVEMSLETLKRIKFLPDFKKALGQLPSELAGLYDIIHSQIERTEPYGQKVAIRTLNWLLCAQRLLSAEELIAAVYVIDDDTSSDSDEDIDFKPVGSPKDDILRLCRNLVVFDSEQEIFRFAHQSVRGYLLKLSRYTTEEQHAFATERCLEIYLTKSLQDPITWQEKRQNAILKPYAEIYWPVHYKYAENSTSIELKNKFLHFTDQIQGTSSPYVEWRSDIFQKYGDHDLRGINIKLQLNMFDKLGRRIFCAKYHPDAPLGVASAFGISSILETCQPSSTELNKYQATPDTFWADHTTSFTLLSLAAREGHDQVVQLLLCKGADVNAFDGLAFQEAARWGQTQIVETLLDQGSIGINDLPTFLKRDLLLACEGSHVSTVRLLLERGADVNPQNSYCGRALFKAAMYGHDSIVQLLLDHGANVKAPSGIDGNALQAACFWGNISTVQLLLDHGADINARSEENVSVLQMALRRGRDHIVQMLLDRGADVAGVDEKALQERCAEGLVSLPSRLKHLVDA